MKEVFSIRNETSVTVGLVIVIFGAAMWLGGMYMTVQDTSDRQKAMEAKINIMSEQIASINATINAKQLSALGPNLPN